jgi:hypothetical protein
MSLADLGRRAVTCKHWRWMEGMQVEPLRFRVVWLTEDMIGESDQTSYFWKNVPDIFPDLSDPATLGCLLALVREAWPHEWHQFMVPIFDGISHWYVGCLMPGTSRIVMPTRVMKNGLLDALPPKPTEAEALVAALEAAP